MRKSRLWRAGGAVQFGVSAALTALFIIANLHDVPQLWGISLPRFVHPSVTLVAFVAALLLVAVVHNRIGSVLANASRAVTHSRTAVWLFTMAVVCMFFILFMLFHSAIPLLGDGSLRANEIFDGRMWQPTEMLDFFAHAVLYQYIFEPLGYKVTICYRVVSALAGVAFLIGVIRLAVYLKRDEFLIIALTLISSGMFVLFFGYVESYSLVAAMLPFVVLVGLKTIDGQAGVGGFIALVLLASVTHSIAAVLFIPGVLIALQAGHSNGTRPSGRLSVALGALAGTGLIVAYVAKGAGVAFFRRIVPLTDGSGGHAVFSTAHYMGIFNWLLLSGLPVFLLIAALASGGYARRSRFRLRALFGVWLAVPALMFLMFFAPQLGAPRDWDLFSLPVFSLLLALLVVWFSAERRTGQLKVLPVVVLSVATTVSFVAINSDVPSAVNRYIEIIAIEEDRNTYFEFASLLRQADNYPQLRHRWEEFGTQALKSARNGADSSYVCSELVRHYLKAGDAVKTSHYIEQGLLTDSSDLALYLLRQAQFDRFGASQRDYLALARAIEMAFPNSGAAQVGAGVIYLKQEMTNAGGRCFARAYQLDSTSFTTALNYGNYYTLTNRHHEAIRMYRRAVSLQPDSYSANLSLGSAYLQTKQYSEAKRALDAAARLASTHSQREEVEYYRSFLNGGI